MIALGVVIICNLVLFRCKLCILGIRKPIPITAQGRKNINTFATYQKTNSYVVVNSRNTHGNSILMTNVRIGMLKYQKLVNVENYVEKIAAHSTPPQIHVREMIPCDWFNHVVSVQFLEAEKNNIS
jgi:hypothetical protein